MTTPATLAPGRPCPHCRAGALALVHENRDRGWRTFYCARCDSYHDDDDGPIDLPRDPQGDPILAHDDP